MKVDVGWWRSPIATWQPWVESRALREDLYYRLSVLPILIPPLRDRTADIRAFAEYFAERAALRQSRSSRSMP